MGTTGATNRSMPLIASVPARCGRRTATPDHVVAKATPPTIAIAMGAYSPNARFGKITSRKTVEIAKAANATTRAYSHSLGTRVQPAIAVTPLSTA